MTNVMQRFLFRRYLFQYFRHFKKLPVLLRGVVQCLLTGKLVGNDVVAQDVGFQRDMRQWFDAGCIDFVELFHPGQYVVQAIDQTSFFLGPHFQPGEVSDFVQEFGRNHL